MTPRHVPAVVAHYVEERNRDACCCFLLRSAHFGHCVFCRVVAAGTRSLSGLQRPRPALVPDLSSLLDSSCPISTACHTVLTHSTYVLHKVPHRPAAALLVSWIAAHISATDVSSAGFCSALGGQTCLGNPISRGSLACCSRSSGTLMTLIPYHRTHVPQAAEIPFHGAQRRDALPQCRRSVAELLCSRTRTCVSHAASQPPYARGWLFAASLGPPTSQLYVLAPQYSPPPPGKDHTLFDLGLRTISFLGGPRRSGRRRCGGPSVTRGSHLWVTTSGCRGVRGRFVLFRSLASSWREL